MKKKTISIKTIAADLGVSTTTVSFVLNGKAREKHISEQMAKRVVEYADKVNYKPNPIAQSLRTGKSNSLVLMVEDISNSFFATLAKIVEDIAYKKGYKVIFCSHENDDKKFEELIDYFTYRMVDGFIIIPSKGVRHKIEQLVEENIPVVLVDRFFDNIPCNIVVVDNKEASYTATHHLIENGYKNIAFITVDLEQSQMIDRLHGYQAATAEINLEPLVLNVPFEKATLPLGKNMIYDFVEENPATDAIFFATNYLTQSALEIFNERKPSIVNNMGLVAFDDNEFFKIYHPSITAVAQPLTDMGTELMRIMVSLLKRKDVKEGVKKVILKAKLNVRNSSLPSP